MRAKVFKLRPLLRRPRQFSIANGEFCAVCRVWGQLVDQNSLKTLVGKLLLGFLYQLSGFPHVSKEYWPSVHSWSKGGFNGNLWNPSGSATDLCTYLNQTETKRTMATANSTTGNGWSVSFLPDHSGILESFMHPCTCTCAYVCYTSWQTRWLIKSPSAIAYHVSEPWDVV